MRRRWAVVAASGALVVATACGGSAATRARLTLKSEQQISLLNNQGVARVADGWILSGTDKPLVATDNLMRTDDDLDVVVRKLGVIPPGLRAQHFDHIGDIDVVSGVIYAPLEQSNYDKDRQVTAMYDARTLAFQGSVVLRQHENSFVTVDTVTMTAYSMDHFDGNTLLRYDIRHKWRPLAPLVLSETLQHTQGADIWNGVLWMSTSDPRNDIYRINLVTGRVDLVGTHGHPGGEGEGMDATPVASAQIHTLITDPNMQHVWFENFAVVTR
ncbi:MAG: hypothetical protein ACJ735_09765 [Actinomycetes bacterium]